MKPTITEQHAWAAGFIDGDGWISIESLGHDGYTAKVEAVQGIEAPLLRLIELFGGTLTAKTHKVDGEKRQYLCWRVRGDNAAACLNALLPHLVVKRRQAELVLAFKATVQAVQSGDGFYYKRVDPETKKLRQEMYREVKALNRRRLYAERLSERAPHYVGMVQQSDPTGM